MTKHFKLSVGLLALLSLLLFGLYRYVAMRIREVIPSRTSSVLSKNDKEVVTFNEKTHTLTVQTKTQTIQEYARNPVVEVRQNGSVAISRHLAGFENSLFLGAGYSDTGRILIGDNFFHLSRFDAMGAVGWTCDSRYPAFKVYTGISYSVYSNTSVGLGADIVSLATGKPMLLGFVSVKL